MSNKSGFLKGLIFKKEGTAEGEGDEKSPKSSAKPVVDPQTFGTNPTIQGVVDNKFVEVLTKVIEDNNQPGQDYFEFKQAIENMNSLSMPEQQKFQTVYSVLGLQGCTKEGLLLSVDEYMKLIQSERSHFDAEMGAISITLRWTVTKSGNC